MSCDKYYDLWDPFFHFFEKYWQDCPYPVYLANNTKTYTRKQINLVHSNYSGTWSEETSIILNKLPYKFIIYLQDDYFILHKVDSSKLKNLLYVMKHYNADYLRIFPSPGPDHSFKNEKEIGLIDVNADYRTSLQAAIWKRETFLKILDLSENQWEFEINSPKRTKNLLFLSIKQKAAGHISRHIYPVTYYYLTAVLRGKWRWGIKNICKKEGLKLDFKYRKSESYRQFIFQKFYHKCPLFVKKTIDYLANTLKIKD